MANNDVYAGALMPRELEKRARIRAANMGISRSKLFRLALEKFLKEENNEVFCGDDRKEDQKEKGENF